jgi:hypothetical protein
MTVKLTSPRVSVVFENGRAPLEVQTDNRDLIAWDETRARHKWPKFEDAPFVWLTFLAWHAARRTGAIETGLTYEAWKGEVLQVAALDDDDENGRPTEPGPAPG